MIFDREELSRRVAGLKERMMNSKFDTVVIINAVDVYYFCGVALHSILVVPGRDEACLFVQINMARARKDSWIKNLIPSVGLPTVVGYMRGKGLDRGIIGIESDVLPVNIYQRLVKEMPEAEFKNVTPLVMSLRGRKSAKEVEYIKRAAEISNHGLRLCRDLIRPGKTELEVRIEMGREEFLVGGEIPLLRNWNQRMDWGVFASGYNTTEISGYWMCETGSGVTPFRPYGPSLKVLEDGDLVCINKGVAYQGYNVDEARTFVVGRANEEQKRVFNALCRAQEAMIERIHDGVMVKEIYFAGWREIDAAGYEKYFMTEAFYHFPYVGHGVGLEIDEPH